MEREAGGVGRRRRGRRVPPPAPPPHLVMAHGHHPMPPPPPPLPGGMGLGWHPGMMPAPPHHMPGPWLGTDDGGDGRDERMEDTSVDATRGGGWRVIRARNR